MRHAVCLITPTTVLTILLALGLCNIPLLASVCNLKVVTDASPDYHDMDGMIHSITSKWEEPAEKCWALFYWNHIGRRQTSPMIVHGVECTDPIRQFNDYGYTMCSTVAGINCSIWDAMGYPVKFWDISNHTVSEVEYGGRWHIYDNSMSAVYTLCDGVTIAAVEDIGKEGACALSGGQSERGHIAKYHCLTANSIKGFLTGADCPRDLEQEYRCFNPNGLKYRYYYHNWDRGHRYILNLRENETYTRHYKSLGDSRSFYVPNKGKDPEAPNRRYRIRGNGIWTYRPELNTDGLKSIHGVTGCVVAKPFGVMPQEAGKRGDIIFKIQAANVITSMSVRAVLLRATEADLNSISVSTTNGLAWTRVWINEKLGESTVNLDLIDEVNGAYEVLVRVRLLGSRKSEDACLKEISFKTITMLNSKTQPKLLLGRNTVFVDTGDQADSIVLWPDLRAEKYESYVVEQRNITSEPKHPGYQGVMHATRPNEDAYVVFRIDAPRDIGRIRYGGRFYNRAPKSHIDLLHSFDNGVTWQKDYSLTRTEPPWDVIHYETIEDIPGNTRSVLFKYLLNSSAAGTSACSIYSVRAEANYRSKEVGFRPIEVTFNWSEMQKDYSTVERSHKQLVTEVPFRYTINIGGVDHPVVNWLRVNLKGALEGVEYGYSNGVDAGGAKHAPRWISYGKNLAEGKRYEVSVPSKTHWGAGDTQGTKLTDGIMGPPYAGGIGPRYALCWDKGDDPIIEVDIEQAKRCGAFRIHLSAGWPWWDAMKGQVKDKVEVLTSLDGRTFASQGFFALNLRWKDIPANHMIPDDETATGFAYDLVPKEPIETRYVRFKITTERTLTVSEVQVLDWIRYRPFDLRIALPDEDARGGSFAELLDIRSVSKVKTWRTFQASGYDRYEGFYDSGNFLRIEKGRRYVLMETTGPGCIDRMWFTYKSEPGREPYDLLIYLDDKEKPVIHVDLDGLFSGKHPPFVVPLAGLCGNKRHPGRYSYIPIAFKSYCKVVLVPTAPKERYQYRVNSLGVTIPHIYYQITYRKFESGQRVTPFNWELDSRGRKVLAEVKDLWSNCGSSPWPNQSGLKQLTAEKTLRPHRTTSLFEVEGAAVVYALRLSVEDPKGLWLTIYWDGAQNPQISVPLGPFFACSDSVKPSENVKGLWLGYADGYYYCYLPMPFRRSAIIAIRSELDAVTSVKARIEYQPEEPAAEDGHLCAHRYDYASPPIGKRYEILNINGKGHFVGLVMDRPGHMEGDDLFFVDGEQQPSIHGTGTEDFYNFAWGLSHTGSFPLHGITIQGNRPICYRMHVPWGVPFRKSLLINWEHGHDTKGGPNLDTRPYSGVVFYYRTDSTY